MRFGFIAALASSAVLAGCASMQGMQHGAMNHDEMMRKCQMMQQHQSGDAGAAHDPAQHGGMSHQDMMHGGMSHEDMMRHCAMMQNQAGAGAAAATERQAAVAAAGAQVMPFDLGRASHAFTDTPWGGEQVVVSNDNDAEQVARIRAHLSAEAAKFARGDFGDPEAIHGADMPGLSVLRERHDSLDVAYAERPGGASITYRSQDRAVIDAIHAWFQAQRTDHGPHAH